LNLLNPEAAMNKPMRRDPQPKTDSRQRDIVFFKERERERELALEKTKRLRDLRLAKEAAAREEAAQLAAEKPAPPKRKRRAVAPLELEEAV